MTEKPSEVRRRKNTASALFGLGYADEVLIDAVGQKAAERRFVATQDDDVTVPLVAQPLGLEAREFLASVGRRFIVPGEQDDEVGRILDRLVHRLDEARAERDVVILDEDLVAFFGQNVRDLLRDGSDRAAPAEEKIELVRDCARHRSGPLRCGSG